MDFGDVLEKWDSVEKKKRSDAAKKNETRINQMKMWIDRYGVIDKDSLAKRDENRVKFISLKQINALRVDAQIDLHGFSVREAEEILFHFVSECEKRGCKKILIIHGKGNHSQNGGFVLGDMVHRFIEQDKRLGMSGHPELSEGGSGATWVVLKKNLLK